VKLKINNLLPLLVMLLLAALTLWLRQAAEFPVRSAHQAVKHDPDAIVDNFTLRSLSADGVAQYAISARRMLHFADDDTTELSNPLFTRVDVDGTRVQVSADRGSLKQDGDEATFYGHVVVRQQTADQPDLTAQTDYVQVLGKQDLIRTDRPIAIHQGESSLTGVGMEIHRQARQFSLYAQVRGSYRAAPK
jgi:lipopolysaccharide export system protein LptC